VTKILFVTNGHGETAIAQRIALDLQTIFPGAQLDHFALVGDRGGDAMREVGPRRTMPSGGLIAMGNVRNLARDLRAGLLGLTLAQLRFLRKARDAYDVSVAVGDAYALGMALCARRPTVFVGSAKSVDVAPYGSFERRLLARAAARFVRDEATADTLRRAGIEAEAANAIVDLFVTPQRTTAEPALAGFAPAIALFPGSRESAYTDAAHLLRIVAGLAARRPAFGAALSIAPGLNADRFAAEARRAGWAIGGSADANVPFVLIRDGREIVRAWSGPLGPLLERVELVLGQAGTANEAAAAAGVPVVAFAGKPERKVRWYRERQQGLLGDALAVVSGSLNESIEAVNQILDDPDRRRRMGEIGRARMGAPGGARRIAERIAALAGAP
jgi:uncharacterized protein (TIGR03492 family)